MNSYLIPGASAIVSRHSTASSSSRDIIVLVGCPAVLDAGFGSRVFRGGMRCFSTEVCGSRVRFNTNVMQHAMAIISNARETNGRTIPFLHFVAIFFRLDSAHVVYVGLRRARKARTYTRA